MKKIIIVLFILAILMFAEYRFIMTNLEPYYAEDGFLYIEFMGQVDTYYAEPLFMEDN